MERLPCRRKSFCEWKPISRLPLHTPSPLYSIQTVIFAVLSSHYVLFIFSLFFLLQSSRLTSKNESSIYSRMEPVCFQQKRNLRITEDFLISLTLSPSFDALLAKRSPLASSFFSYRLLFFFFCKSNNRSIKECLNRSLFSISSISDSPHYILSSHLLCARN